MEDLTTAAQQLTGSANPFWQWVFCVAIFLLFLLLSQLYRYKAVKLTTRLFKRLRGSAWEDLLHAITGPVASFIFLLGLCIALWNLPLSTAALTTTRNLTARGARLVTLALLAWAGCGIVDTTPAFKFKFLGSAEAVRRMLRRALKVLIVVFTVLAAMGELGFQVSGLITGLGLGGLTVSLAAKDSAANLFAGLVLLVEKPFAIGDWITCAGVEGTVEDLTFRSTKIREMDNTLSILPNSVVSAGLITNGSSRKMRMGEFTLTVCYETPRKTLELLMRDLRDMLSADSALHSGTVLVRFVGFSASSMDILVRYFTKSADYNESLAINERLYLAIMDLMERHGVSFAFPSTSVYLQNATPPKPTNTTPPV
ncbi:MAG: MscS family rane protein [Clostridiales bacterium]|jgi:MscS family membrane protein|nr:MscS family rane protein [Clostridiales bacterium]